jgi:hypothetical protein
VSPGFLTVRPGGCTVDDAPERALCARGDAAVSDGVGLIAFGVWMALCSLIGDRNARLSEVPKSTLRFNAGMTVAAWKRSNHRFAVIFRVVGAGFVVLGVVSLVTSL